MEVATVSHYYEALIKNFRSYIPFNTPREGGQHKAR